MICYCISLPKIKINSPTHTAMFLNFSYLETLSEHDSALKSVVQHEQVVAVIIHRTDRIKSKLYISHPTVKIHVLNSATGEYLKKSIVRRPGSYNFEKPSVDHLLPLMTKPSNFRLDDKQSFPVWEELLLFNESYSYVTKTENQVLFIFEASFQ